MDPLQILQNLAPYWPLIYYTDYRQKGTDKMGQPIYIKKPTWVLSSKLSNPVIGDTPEAVISKLSKKIK